MGLFIGQRRGHQMDSLALPGALSGVKTSMPGRRLIYCHYDWKVWDAMEFGERISWLLPPTLLRGFGSTQCAEGRELGSHSTSAMH